MKASDYIVEFLISKGITDAFGYPGGMVTHLLESFDKYSTRIRAHANYHEQASAMAACGLAEISGLPGVAYATSGPGATNLLTGVACSYFESIPCLFITGQVNTYEQKGTLCVRQRGFQETDIVAMATPVTKWAAAVQNVSELPEMLEKAYYVAMEGRRGPVLLDIPMDVFRGEILPSHTHAINTDNIDQDEIAIAVTTVLDALKKAKKPVLLLGHGIALAEQTQSVRRLVQQLGIPAVTSMIAVDALQTDDIHNYGFIGAYGSRTANYITNYSDLLIALGSRMDCRQTGVDKSLFASKSQIVRVDIDCDEMTNRTNEQEIQLRVSLQDLIPQLLKLTTDWNAKKYECWINTCNKTREKLAGTDIENPGNVAAKALGKVFPADGVVTTDVGQNQVWVAQSFPVRDYQRVLFSGGHGAMGYSLPAAIGAALAAKKPVLCCTGDGGLQMNLQELQFIVREQLPIKIVVFNNRALGMIHHFQEMYFDSNYVQTDDSKGFTVPNFTKIAKAYGIRSACCKVDELEAVAPLMIDEHPLLIDLILPQTTHVFPKLGMNVPIHEQEPLLNENLKSELHNLLDW